MEVARLGQGAHFEGGGGGGGAPGGGVARVDSGRHGAACNTTLLSPLTANMKAQSI